MTETIRANILNEYTITNNEEGIKLYHVVENIRSMPEGELKAIHYMSLNDKMREMLETSRMLLVTTLTEEKEVVILELDIESDNTSWTVEPKWDEYGSLYFELSNPIKVHEQVNV